MKKVVCIFSGSRNCPDIYNMLWNADCYHSIPHTECKFIKRKCQQHLKISSKAKCKKIKETQER